VENKEPNAVAPFEAALVIIVTFFLSAFLGAALYLTVDTGLALVIGELIILIVPLAYLLGKHVPIRNYIRIDLKPKHLLLGIAAGFAMLILNIVVTGILVAIFGTSQAVEESNILLLETSSTPTGLILVAVSLALAGICEEFAFRGFLQNSLFRTLKKNTKYQKYAFAIAVTISALVFGIFHLDLQVVYTLAAFISGLALGYIYHRGNYVSAATTHATMNLIVLLLLLFGY
jgi:membrane protease YdiL (CAAX protease family)